MESISAILLFFEFLTTPRLMKDLLSSTSFSVKNSSKDFSPEVSDPKKYIGYDSISPPFPLLALSEAEVSPSPSLLPLSGIYQA